MTKFLHTPFLALVTLLLTFASAAQADRLLDRVAAVVNDQIILQSELELKTQQTAQQLQAQNIPVNDFAELQTQVLDNLIMETLQVQRARQLGLNVSDEEVNEQLTQIATQNRMSLLELRNRLNAEMANGFAKVRDDIRQKLLIQKLREQEVISRTLVTEEEINNYLQRSRLDTSNQEYHLRHILITLPESATVEERQQARAQIDELLKRLQSGELFSQLAVRYSKGSRALTGGDLGWLKEEQIPTFFAEAIQDLQPGQISPVINSPSGLHLIKLEAKRDANQQLVTQYRLHRFIVLSDNATAQSEIPPDIQKIAATTRSLADFQTLWQQFADIPEEVNAQSDLGWKTAEELPFALKQALAELSPNQVATPIATEQGWVLFFLEDVRELDINKANEQQQAIQEIRKRKANETFDIWLRRLKDEAFIDIRLQ